MKNKLLLFALLCFMLISLVACNTNDPQEHPRIHSGNVVGTLGCYSENHETFYKGYYVKTEVDSIYLCFSLEEIESLEVRYGNYAINPIAIPYKFIIEVLNEEDNRYVHYSLPTDDAMHQPVTAPYEIKQVLITRYK